jgi:transposase
LQQEKDAMKNYIGLDIASEVTSVCVMNEKGKVLLRTNVFTQAGSLLSVIKAVKRPRIVVFEECTQAAWLFSVLEPYSDKVIVSNPHQTRNLSGKNKSDQSDAYNLADRARANILPKVWHGGQQVQQLREALRLYQSLTTDSTAVKNQIKAVFRSRGIAVGDKAYDPLSREATLEKLPYKIQKSRVLHLGDVLDTITMAREQAHVELVEYAKKNPFFKKLVAIDGIGEIFAAMILAEVGTPSRFRTRSQFWSYVGLAVTTFESAQYGVGPQGEITKKRRHTNTRGLVRHYNRTLKYVFKQMALQLSRTKWKDKHQDLLNKGVSHTNALLTLARKAAAVTFHVLKKGDAYDLKLVFTAS